MPKLLTPDEVKLARELRRGGMNWSTIGRTLGRESRFVRKQVDVEFSERRTILAADWVKKQRVGMGAECPKPHLGKRPDRFFVPPDVEADKDRRNLLEHSSLTASLLGDPLPGRSALDQRGEHGDRNEP